MKYSSNYHFLPTLIAALFILLFVYTAVSKLLVFAAFRHTLDQFPLLHENSLLFAWAIPITELIISAWLFFPATRLLGFYASFGLMSLFTVYIAYALLFASNLPCSCGGVISKMTWTQHLIFNLFFTALAPAGIKLSKHQLLISRRSRIPV